MKSKLIALATLAAFGGCAPVSMSEAASGADSALAAIERAQLRECPADRRRDDARREGFGATAGVESIDITQTPSADDRVVRMRRVVVQPGGVIAWHDHTQAQGMALIVSGEMTELRNTCLDPIVYRAGDIAREDAATAHSWRNEGQASAVILVAHSAPR